MIEGFFGVLIGIVIGTCFGLTAYKQERKKQFRKRYPHDAA